MVPKVVIGTGALLDVFMVEMLLGRILRRAGGGMLPFLGASLDADPEKMGLCRTVVSSCSWISG